VGKHQTSIEINGRNYDARTGKPIAGHAVSAPAKPMMDIAPRSTSVKQVHTKPERSKTLMRHAVKKPVKLVTNKFNVGKAMVDISAPIKHSSARPNSIHHQFDAEREKRAQQIKRSNLVRKFSGLSGHQAAPVGIDHDQPVPQRVEAMAVQPVPHHAHPVKLPPSNSVIEKGLRAAQSHSEAPYKAAKHPKARRRTRLASMSAGVLAVVLLGAFFAYQNMPNISMRYAAARSGVSASIPGYQPSGFALNHHIQYTPGQIKMSFNSNADDREFTITQRESSWNSETLRSNYVVGAAENIQTFEDKGRTIYLYGDSNATWVNGGVWYDINGNSQLNSDQLIRIATSM
jgi:hypothetical protein